MDYITSRNQFDTAINSASITLCIFSAAWCGPCKMLSPVIDQYYSDCMENNADITIIKVNVDEYSDIASEHNVSSIPCLMLFRGGKCIADRVGFVSKAALSDWVTQYA